jgi:hypothetical protein
VSTRTSDPQPPDGGAAGLAELLLADPEIIAWLGLDERTASGSEREGNGPLAPARR